MVVKAVTGPDFETEFCNISADEVENWRRRVKVRDFRDGLELVKSWQPQLGNWNPRKPKTRLADCLFRHIASRLKGGSDLRLYISVGTMMDRRGVDCFFELDRRFVTIDLTISTFKVYKRPGTDLILTRANFERNQHYKIGEWIAHRLSNPQS